MCFVLGGLWGGLGGREEPDVQGAAESAAGERAVHGAGEAGGEDAFPRAEHLHHAGLRKVKGGGEQLQALPGRDCGHLRGAQPGVPEGGEVVGQFQMLSVGWRFRPPAGAIERP
eukprot:3299843-Pyramimonas_sp.AAC.1